ncbi:MAG: type IVB secretion system protein IcmH/DotU [Rubellimicrobium sp.]|nr:type IVB secretion system protein IcmH/DotU [Rubellimicrobium sp.]
MSGDDRDRTVFGGKLPDSNSPFGTPAPGGDKTQIGGAFPDPFATPGGRTAPAQGGWGPAPSGGNTWLGGAVPQYPPQSAPIGAGQGMGTRPEGFFPDIPPQSAPAEQRIQPRIALEQALRATGIGKGGSSNPLVAAAANLLILLGRLRTGLVELQVAPLMDHVTREIAQYEQIAVDRGADPQEAQVAKFALCATADDIVQNLPGGNRSAWIQYSMVARFFQRRDSGVVFFQEAEKAMQAPGQRYRLLELMLVCLSLGFEGQYRTLPNGSIELARIRSAIYETLRRVNPRPPEDISVMWEAVPMRGRRRFGGVPIWVAASLGALLTVGTYAALSTLLAGDSNQVARDLTRMHPNVGQVSLIRTAAVQEVYVPPPPDTSQLDRVIESLQEDIDAGVIEVGTRGDFIFLRVSNLLLFNSGSATVKPEFAELGDHIAETLEGEAGAVKIIGYTDDIQPSGRGLYKTNQELSVARAEGVAAVLAPLLSDPERITVEGRGEAEPIADNATEEGRALNRRVEILLAREGTF